MPDLQAAHDSTPGERAWLASQFESLTTEIASLTVSEWAEQRRYLTPSVSPLPGLYSFEVTPYLREIVDCMSVDSPVREVAVMKGSQLGLTVGLENIIGYYIDHVKTAPVMMVTADDGLAQLRADSYITPMLQASGLTHLIQSADEKNPRKTGKKEGKIEWLGGGFLVLIGAQNENKFRSTSAQALLNDEVDGWPDSVGKKQGDPVALARRCTEAFTTSRKNFDISTPLLADTSKIAKLFERGDQRYYFVRCLKCNFHQVLKWIHTDRETGVVTGMTWETEAGRIVPDSVRYLCQACSHPHTNDDKTRLLSPDHGAEWRPTAEPISPEIRSYHLSALYAPASMQTWSALVHKWIEAWDVENDRMKDPGKLQVFYNNVLGKTFRVYGERVRFEAVSPHRRGFYSFGEVPNTVLEKHCDGPVLLVTCAVDVHKDNLAVAVFGWCRFRRAVLLDYWRFEGDTEQVDDPGTWGRLSELIEQKEYVADDGKAYRIALALIDSGYLADQVYRFASQYEAGVFPCKGVDAPSRTAKVEEFYSFKTKAGVIAYGINVDRYKDRWSAALRREWNMLGSQPQGHFNAPKDVRDDQLKELTVEVKRPRVKNDRQQGFEWRRPSGAANELWDLLVYNNAALDIIAWDVCMAQLEMEAVNWNDFWNFCEHGFPSNPGPLFFEA